MNASPLISDQPARILNRDTLDRLEIVNDAERFLREFGVSVLKRDLRSGTTLMPLITVRLRDPIRHDQPLPLQDTSLEHLDGQLAQIGHLGSVQVAILLGGAA